jgi:hypothetical protein
MSVMVAAVGQEIAGGWRVPSSDGGVMWWAAGAAGHFAHHRGLPYPEGESARTQAANMRLRAGNSRDLSGFPEIAAFEM